MIKIPHEKSASNSQFQSLKKKQQLSEAISIRRKMAHKQTLKDQKILGQTALKLVKYLKSPYSIDLEGINDLSHDMQRSILCLQSHKKKIVEKSSKKR